MTKIKLFFLPYAGGSVEIYRTWKRYLAQTIEIYPIELPGRGKRTDTPLYDSLENAIEDIYQMISHQLEDGPYAFFGHSLGNILSYELYYRIKALEKPLPIHMFFSGRGAPNLQHEEKKVHQLSETELIKELKELGGTPPELLREPELLKIFLPVIRADFKIVETYKFMDKQAKMDCNISVFNGTKDDIRFDELIEWRKHTNKECKFYNLPGGHFFINDYVAEICKIINGTLSVTK